MQIEKIADVNMSWQSKEFRNLFDKNIDYKINVGIDAYGNKLATSVDEYGYLMKYTDIHTVIEFLEKIIAENEDKDEYVIDRKPILLGLLKSIDEEQWDEIQIVHYKY